MDEERQGAVYDARRVRRVARERDGENIVEDVDEFRAEGRGTSAAGIGWGQGIAMIAVAALIDLLQFFLTFLLIGLVVNFFISIVALLIFYGWFSVNGVSFLAGKRAFTRLMTFSAGFLGELIPLINAMPLWTASITMTVLQSRRRDV